MLGIWWDCKWFRAHAKSTRPLPPLPLEPFRYYQYIAFVATADPVAWERELTRPVQRPVSTHAERGAAQPHFCLHAASRGEDVQCRYGRFSVSQLPRLYTRECVCTH